MNAPAIRFHDRAPPVADLQAAVVRGLASRPKAIPPKFFYDAAGSQLFDAICELPEYYLTRTEMQILEDCATELARRVGRDALLIELGCGASKKVRLLLSALRPAAYVGVDISREFLLDSATRLARDYPWLEVHAACTDFSESLELPDNLSGDARLVFFPGSSIGNLTPLEAVRFLRMLRGALGPRDRLLIGVDTKKDPRVLHRAYNDGQGLTAAFNRNLLVRICGELDADLDPALFDHRAFYNGLRGRIEMHLVSRRDHELEVAGQRFRMGRAESIHTENSYKYTTAEFERLSTAAGWIRERVWTDAAGLFSVHLLAHEGTYRVGI